MALKGRFSSNQLRHEMEKDNQVFKDKIRQILSSEGQQFVQEAFEQPANHSQGFYEDESGDLRMSIGYYLFEYGQLIEESYTATRGENLTLLQPHINPDVMFQLMGIAGKSYATYVENKGFNVITAQHDALLVRLDQRFTMLANEINGNV